MLAELKKAIIERVSRNGFDDIRLYNDELLHLEELDIERFKQLSAIISKSTGERTNEIKINELGMTDLQKAQAEVAEKKKRQKEPLSEEEAEALKKLKELNKGKKYIRPIKSELYFEEDEIKPTYRQEIKLQPKKLAPPLFLDQPGYFSHHLVFSPNHPCSKNQNYPLLL